MERWQSYDAVASQYDLGRPGYPEPLVDDCIKLAGLGPDSRILEIGAGSGQASISFAKHGFQMICLEPGASLASLARNNLSNFPRAVIQEKRFEDWPLEEGAFALVLAATSIHHVEKGVQYTKSALALKPAGHIAIISNQPGEDEPVFRKELDRLYAKWWGEQTSQIYKKRTLENRVATTRKQIENSGKFGPVEIRQYPWTVEYDVPRYMALLDSDSSRLNHPPEAQEGLKRDIGEAITRMGGLVQRGFVAVLAIAKIR